MKEVCYELKETVINCDNCEKEFVVESTNYNEINEELKFNKWLTRQINNEWCDFCCLECYKEFIKGGGK